MSNRSDGPVPLSYAILAEFETAQNKMISGSNRRIFNREEAMAGNKIRPEKNDLGGYTGAIVLQAGTYRINGFSTVTMQTEFYKKQVNEHFPGYCVLYRLEDEDDTRHKNFCVGSWALSDGSYPSLFDCFFTCESETTICVGHQAGDVEKHEEDVYYGVNSEGVDEYGEPRTSGQRLFARIAICEI